MCDVAKKIQLKKKKSWNVTAPSDQQLLQRFKSEQQFWNQIISRLKRAFGPKTECKVKKKGERRTCASKEQKGTKGKDAGWTSLSGASASRCTGQSAAAPSARSQTHLVSAGL